MCKTFHLDISKEGLENEFNGNYERIRAEAEQTEQRKNLPDTTNRWKQLAQDQAKTLEIVITERNELQVKYQKMNEFILEFQERTRNLKMEKQKLFFKNHEMQEEIRKLNVEIQHQIIELSETQKLNQSLQQSNDDLRSRNGLMSRKEQEQLEKEIKLQSEKIKEIKVFCGIGYIMVIVFAVCIIGIYFL